MIAELLKGWGRDQEEADLWLIENFNDQESPIVRRDAPLHKDSLERRRKERATKMQSEAQDRERYRSSVQDYFDRVVGKSGG